MQKLSLTNKYTPHQKYKDSGVEWLGDIPESWSCDYLRGFTKQNRVKNIDGNNRNLLSLSYGRIIDKDIDANGGLLPESFNTYQVVRKGDIVLRLTDLQNDKKSLRVGYVEQENGIITSAYLGLNIEQECNTKFMYYLLHSYDLQKVFYNLGGGVRQILDYKNMKYLPILLPPKEDQERIAQFLDEQITRIDGTIAKKERLIKLLKEKRTAVINHAVTKGLDPNVKLSDSGIDWIGKIPEDWKVMKMKFLTRKPLQYGLNEAALSEDPEGVRFIRISDVKTDGTLRKNTFKSLPFEIARPYILSEGDMLFARTGATAGKSFMYKKEWGQCCFAGYLIRLSSDEKKVDHNFLNLVTYSDYYLQWTRSIFIQSTIQNISAEKYKEFSVALPPVEIQNKIVRQVGKILEPIDLAQEKINSSIVLLQELKSSLISHAVTGKIKI